MRAGAWSLLFVAGVLLWLGLGSNGPLKADAPLPQGERELHVVAVYGGATKTGNEVHGGRATVVVDRPSKKVTLVLTAYEPVTWDVQVRPGSMIEKIVLGGDQPQALKSKPPGAMLVRAYPGGGTQPELTSIGFTIDSPKFRAFVEGKKPWSDVEVASFYGAPRAQAAIPVDQVQVDERLWSSYPKVTPPEELPQLSFRAVHVVRGDRAYEVRGASGDFTLQGPIAETLRPLPDKIYRMTQDPVNRKFFGIKMHDMVELDAALQHADKIDVGLEVPRLSWPADITFDERRGRVLLVSSGGGGYLYAYEAKTGTWSVLTEKIGVASLVYHSKHDCLYGIAVQHGEDGGQPVLRQFSPNGALLKETLLGSPVLKGVFSPGPGPSGTQLVAVDDYVVAIAAPINVDRSSELQARTTYMYLIHPRTEKVWLTWKQRG